MFPPVITFHSELWRWRWPDLPGGWAWSWIRVLSRRFSFFLTAAMLLALAFRPVIKVYDAHLEIGKRIIPWQDVRRVDRTGWISPLVVKLYSLRR